MPGLRCSAPTFSRCRTGHGARRLLAHVLVSISVSRGQENSMSTDKSRTGLQLRSLVRASGELQLSLFDVTIPDPAPDEVIVRVEAAPINPSDLGLLFGAADIGTTKASGTAAKPVITARIPDKAMKSMAGRLDQSMPVGNEGAGVVVAAGSSAAAQALLGRTVALLGGAMYSQYRCVKA